MPLYEYQCEACHRRTEKIQKFSDPELTVCPYCGGKLERTLTAPAVHFAGGGWYKDLYSSAKPTAAGGAGEAAPASPASGGAPAAGGGESAPAGGTPSANSVAPSAPPASTPAPAPGASSGSKGAS